MLESKDLHNESDPYLDIRVCNCAACGRTIVSPKDRMVYHRSHQLMKKWPAGIVACRVPDGARNKPYCRSCAMELQLITGNPDILPLGVES